jgi:MFS transporter, DHA1 family, staphyloferrin A biosynthesis exporter
VNEPSSPPLTTVAGALPRVDGRSEGSAERAEARTRQAGGGLLSSLQYRDFRYLWTGTVFMSGGQWIQQVTLGWLAYDLTGSPIALGAINGLRALPFLVVGPTAGVLADRMDRRKLLITIQGVLVVTAVCMGALVASGLVEVWHLFVFALITASFWAVNQPLRQTLVPSVVPREALMNAIALNSLAFNITKVLGPTAGGFLIAAFGPGGNFFVQGFAYICVMAAIYGMQVAPHDAAAARQSSVMANLREGLSYVKSSPVVLGLMISALVPSIFAQPYQTLMPVFQKDVLGQGPEALGLMLAAPGVGAVLAALLLASLGGFRRKGILLLFSLLALGISLILFSRMTALPLALLTLVGVGGCQVFYAATTNTMLQIIVPDELRGRVISIYMLDQGLSPAGALMAGVSTHFVGAPITVAVMGCLVIALAAVVAWRIPMLREVET